MRISDWSSDVCSSDLAGLDTVTNAMSFGMRHLAHDDGLRQRAIDDPAVIPSMVAALLRRYAFVATPRYIVEDTELEGGRLFAGASILPPLPPVGMDEVLPAAQIRRAAARGKVSHDGMYT